MENNLTETFTENESTENFDENYSSGFKFSSLEEFFSLFDEGSLSDFSITLTDWRRWKRNNSKSKPVSFSLKLGKNCIDAMRNNFEDERFSNYCQDDTIEQYSVSTVYTVGDNAPVYTGVPLGVYSVDSKEFEVLNILFRSAYVTLYAGYCARECNSDIPLIRDGSGIDIKLSYRNAKGYADTKNAIVIKPALGYLFGRIPEDFTPRIK